MDLSSDGGGDHDHRYLRHHAAQNYTMTSSVSIRVTPLHDHFVSWGILWAGFLVASIFAAWQVVRENRIMASRQTQGVDDGEQGGAGVGDAESVSTADITRSIVSCCGIYKLNVVASVVLTDSFSLFFVDAPVSTVAFIGHAFSCGTHSGTDLVVSHMVAIRW